MRVDDWVKFNVGDHVTEKDGRHVGRVEAIINHQVKVKWLGTGWITWFDLDDDLVVVDSADRKWRATVDHVNTAPATVVASPKRRLGLK